MANIVRKWIALQTLQKESRKLLFYDFYRSFEIWDGELEALQTFHSKSSKIPIFRS